MGNTSARVITFLCEIVPMQKTYKLEILIIIRKKRKMSVPRCQSKFEIGKKKKNHFHNDTILAAAFP
jgi:hypothetical protein